MRNNVCEIVQLPVRAFELFGLLLKQSLLPLSLGNVTRDFRCAYDLACFIPDGRYGKRNIQQAAILGSPDGVEVLNALATLYQRKYFWLFIEPVGRKKNVNGFSDYFFGLVAENALGRRIPAGDDAFEGFADNGVLRRIDNGGKQGLLGFGFLDLRNVARDLRCAYYYSRIVNDRRDGSETFTAFPPLAKRMVS